MNAIPWIISRRTVQVDQQQMSTAAPSPPNGASERTSRTNLYIKGISEDFTNAKLRELVPDPSQVKSVKAATEDQDAAKSRGSSTPTTTTIGYGFIDFHTEEAAMDALRYIQKNHPTYTVKFAKENEKDKTNLYVTNIPKTWTTKDSDRLKEIFEKYGQIQSAFIMVERTTNRPTAAAPYYLRRSGVGFVRFATEDDAVCALDGIRSNPVVLTGCSSPVEAKFADKHNPESRRRKVAGQLNGTVRGALPSSNQMPLIPTAATVGYSPNALYSFYQQRAALASQAASASQVSPYQLATAYPGLSQSLFNNSIYQLSSAQNPASALQSLAGHNNGLGVADGSNGLSSSYPASQFFLSNGLASPAGLTAYATHGLDYTGSQAASYPAYFQAAQPAEHL